MRITRGIPDREAGFSIVELMVASAVSLILLAGVLTLFSHSRKIYESNERLARIQENGRFALDQIAFDLRSAGYKGCQRRLPATNPLKNQLHNGTTLLWNFAVPVEGFEATSAAAWTPAISALVISPLGGNDVLVIRGPRRDSRALRLNAAMSAADGDISVVDAGSQDISGNDVVMISSCREASVLRASTYTHTSGLGTIAHVGTATAPSDLTIAANVSGSAGHTYDEFATAVPVETVIYYVRTNNGIPTLYRRSGSAAAQPVIDGIDAMQVMYGVDTNGDLWADEYQTANTIASGNAWGGVVSVSVGLLVRSSEEYGTDTDEATYKVLGADFGPYGDRHQRMVFTTTVAVRNQAK